MRAFSIVEATRGGDDARVGAFREMLAKVETWGYFDMQNERIKVHVDQT